MIKIMVANMLLLYLFSFAAGLVLGGIYALIFYRANRSGLKRVHAFCIFFLRYLMLFSAFWVLFFIFKLNIYVGVASFFIAYWGVLLYCSKIKDNDES